MTELANAHSPKRLSAVYLKTLLPNAAMPDEVPSVVITSVGKSTFLVFVSYYSRVFARNSVDYGVARLTSPEYTFVTYKGEQLFNRDYLSS